MTSQLPAAQLPAARLPLAAHPLDGVPGAFATWEYPYFRDDADSWRPRLLQLRSLGARVISTYIPWRHHEVRDDVGDGDGTSYDFDGRTRPNRDVRGLVRLCSELGLSVLLKPGPFCHAELNYGGLPDRVRPGPESGISPRLDGAGAPTTWVGSVAGADGEAEQWSLPSVADPRFLAEVDGWLAAVRDAVLAPACPPNGPLVAVQVGNEGVFSDAQHPVWAHDYSRPAVEAYRRWLATRHGADLVACSQAHGLDYPSWDDVDPPTRRDPVPDQARAGRWADWAAWQGHALGECYDRWRRLLALPVPAFANVNPPLGQPWGIDAWLARVDPDAWGGVRYGYTNWIGLAAREPSALARYMLLTRVRPGPNLEENWGFSEQYDTRYQHPNVCFQQTLVAIAGGAKGVNVYTAVSTDAWDVELDRFQSRPYPAHAPIRPDGSLWAMSTVVADLAAYLHEHGVELAESVPVGGVAWGADRHAARWAAWADEDGLPGGEGPGTGRVPSPGSRYLATHATLADAGIDLDVVDLDLPLPDPASVLVVAGVPVMRRDVWARIARFAGAGGRVVVLGGAPGHDERGGPLDDVEGLTVLGRVEDLPGWLTGAARVRPVARTGDALVWVRRHPVSGVVHLIVVTRDLGEVRVDVPNGSTTVPVTLRIAPDAGAVLRIDGTKVTSALLKGAAEQTGVTVVPWVEVDGARIAGDQPGDLLAGIDRPAQHS